MEHVAELFNKVTGQEVRVACAEVGVDSTSLEMVASPNMTLAVSMLLRGAKEGACPVGILHTPSPKSVVQDVPAAQPAAQPAQPYAQPAQPAQPAEPQTLNQRFGAATEPAAPVTPVVPAATPLVDSADDDDFDEDEDEDIKRGGFFSRWWKNKIKKGLDDAFRNPEDEDDGDDY